MSAKKKEVKNAASETASTVAAPVLTQTGRIETPKEDTVEGYSAKDKICRVIYTEGTERKVLVLPVLEAKIEGHASISTPLQFDEIDTIINDRAPDLKVGVPEILAAPQEFYLVFDATHLDFEMFRIPGKTGDIKMEESFSGKVEKCKRTLPCAFTVEEIKAKSSDLCKLIEQRDSAEESKKSVNASWTERIKDLDKHISESAKLLDSGRMDKVIDCEWRFDVPTKGFKSLYRLDTKACIDTQEMNLVDGVAPLADKNKKKEEKPEKNDKTQSAPEKKEEDIKVGDNGKSFRFDCKRDVEIVEYNDVKASFTPEIAKTDIVSKGHDPENPKKITLFTEDELRSFAPLPEHFRVVRSEKKYFIQILHPEVKKEEKKEVAKPTASTPQTGENIAFFLTQHGLAVAAVEKYLIENRRLAEEEKLASSPLAVEFVKKNVEQIKIEIKKASAAA